MPISVIQRWTCALLLGCLVACQAVSSESKLTGVGMSGIDHLAEHLSVQDYQVDGRSGFQAGKGGSVVCCAKVPLNWRPGMTVRVTWNVTNWRDRTSEEKSAVVPVDRYEELGRMYVHFLADGSVRVRFPTTPLGAVNILALATFLKRSPGRSIPGPPASTSTLLNELMAWTPVGDIAIDKWWMWEDFNVHP